MNFRQLLVVLSLFCASSGATSYRRPEVAQERRNALELSAERFEAHRRAVHEHIVLPTTREFYQEGAALCWAHATMNTLESHYLQRHPGSSLELSRNVMQYFHWEERYRRWIYQGDPYLAEGGTTLDALTLIRKQGLFAYGDYFEKPAAPIAWNNPFSILGTTVEEKLASLYESLDRRIGKPPGETHFQGATVRPQSLANRVLEHGDWEAYAPSLDGTLGHARHWDPDSWAETQSMYVPKADFFRQIYLSLRRGNALAISVCGHDILLYGGDFTEQQEAVAYYIKDSNRSLGGNFYKIDPAKIDLGKNFCGYTTRRL